MFVIHLERGVRNFITAGIILRENATERIGRVMIAVPIARNENLNLAICPIF
jgi:hypothetical protein